MLTSAVLAVSERNTAGLEAFGGLLHPAEDSLEQGLVTGFGLTWPLAKNTRVAVHFSYANLPSRGEVDGLLEGRLTLSPFLVFLRQDIPLGDKLTVHIAGGGGIVFARLREGNIITIPEVTISQRLPNSAALHFAGRVSISLTRSLALFVQGGCFLCRTKGTTTIRDMNFGVSSREFDADLSSFQEIAGLTFYF